MQKSNLII